MIDECKCLVMKDKIGVYLVMINVVIKNIIFILINKLVGNDNCMIFLVSVSNIVVIFDNIFKEIENKFGFKFSDICICMKIFEFGYMMLFVIVDKYFDCVIFYYCGVNLFMMMGFCDMKISNKNFGFDILDIMKVLG